MLVIGNGIVPKKCKTKLDLGLNPGEEHTIMERSHDCGFSHATTFIQSRAVRKFSSYYTKGDPDRT